MRKKKLSLRKRLRINSTAITKMACKWTGGALTIWGFLCLFVSMSDVIPDSCSFFYKILIGCLALICVFVFFAILSAVNVLLTNKKVVITSNSQNVYVQYGDILSPNVIDKGYQEKRNVVIPVNRCFDTLVDDRLVSHKTIHGMVFQNLYDNHSHTQESVNETIQESLAKNSSHFYLLQKDEKPEGNLKRYDVGTLAELKIDEHLSFYLLALSTFDENLNAHTSKEDFVLSVQRLIEFCDNHAQGYPVVLPLLGSGLSRAGIDLTDILHYLVEAFAINKDKISCDFHIVIWDGFKDRISIKDLCRNFS